MLEHLRHVLGRARLVRRAARCRARRRPRASPRCISSVSAPIGIAALERALDDLVVDVGDVAHVGDAVADAPQPALDDVERHHEARVAHVAVVVDGDAADVHADVARLDRREASRSRASACCGCEVSCSGRPASHLAPRRDRGEKGCRHRVRTLQSIQYSGPLCAQIDVAAAAAPSAPLSTDASPDRSLPSPLLLARCAGLRGRRAPRSPTS